MSQPSPEKNPVNSELPEGDHVGAIGSNGAAVVRAGSVASAQAEYVEIPRLGAIKLASISQRAMARIIDGVVVVLIYIVCVMLGGALGAASGSSSGTEGGGILGGVLGAIGAFFIALLLGYVYEAIMVGFWGQTVGKMLLKIRVVKTQTGQHPNLVVSVVRFLIPGVCSLIPFIGLLGMLMCFLSATFDNSGRRQGWHDKVANTYVVSAR